MLAKLRLLSAVVLTLTIHPLTNALVIDRDAAPIAFPVVKRVNMTGTTKLVEVDQARARALRERAQGKWDHHHPPPPVHVTNQVVTYVAQVEVDKQPFALIVDTGSSNTWVGAGLQQYNDTGKTSEGCVSVSYGSGYIFGAVYNGTVTLGRRLAIQKQTFGSAYFAIGFNDVDGILGIGPTDLTEGTIDPAPPSGLTPTVTDNAYTQRLIRHKEVCMFYAPAKSQSDPNGELTFGGSNPDKCTGSLNYVPITTVSPASSFVGIDLKKITFNGDVLSSAVTSGIVDTGTTLIYLPTDTFSAYQNATNATLDDNTGLLKITKEQYDELPPLNFHIGETTYGLTPNGQIWPRALNTLIGGEADAIYLVVGDSGAVSGSGLDFIIGYTFLERFYHCYDSQNNQAGFATTPYTHATTN
ncbi:acid protease [Polyporus arcularius HHB13444]|uniref:Acid protease n=1 Tax=Polyporus arcularius HHB13444 TaxID=1314778 RepID=A0A5C3PNW0_9APHY|nr:acid protease [Polyporus arcularius HHB13444]